MSEPRLRLDRPLPDRLAVGLGQYLLVQGVVEGVGSPGLRVELDPPAAERECALEFFPGDADRQHRFLVTIAWGSEDIGTTPEVTLVLTDDNGVASRHSLGRLAIVANENIAVPNAPTMGEDPLVAICMATFNPEMSRLRRQVESILCQSYQNWLLIICDDASERFDTYEVEALCRRDPRRIRLYRHRQNLGFYHNFERALAYLPGNAQLVAFADQDDIWYPEKLQVLVDLLNRDSETRLAYSDMRIVDPSGKLIADSYWQNRRNEYQDLATVLVANTVTGAASLFRRELLERALPFPMQWGDSYHDHWLACVALSSGRLSYCEEPLYDYVQYSDSVLGHQNDRQVPLLEHVAGKLPGGATPVDKWQAVYLRDGIRLQLLARTLHLRIPGWRGAAALRLMGGRWLSSLRLLWAYTRNRVRGRTTQSAELWLAIGFLRGRGRKSNCRLND